MSGLRLLITAIVLFAFAACGGASRAPAPRLPANTDAQLKALGCPEGVDSALWAELKEALEEAFLSEEESRLSSRDSVGKESRLENRDSLLKEQDGHSMLCPYKSVATPPTGEANRVNDLAITDNGDGTYTLTWHYRNLGDYDQDGVVALEDIIPLAEHFGQSVPESDTERNSLQAVIDGSGNGRVGIEDVTPIAQNFQRDVARYMIEGADSEEGPWEAVGEVAQDAGNGEGRLEYSSVISSPAALWHRVVPYDAEGNPGEPSNAVLRPSNEPIIYSVTPTSGYQHEEFTFTATVSGQEPLSYAWDFGGGATPDASSAVFPTVTLSEAGEYEAVLTVTNSDSSTTFPFALTVNERDTWVHTWSVEGRDSVSSIAVDEEGNIWPVGSRLLKFSPSGELLLARSLGGNDIAVTGNGALWVIDETDEYGAGALDVLLLKYDLDGNLLLAKTCGADWLDVPVAMTIDQEGNLYITGARVSEPFGDNDLILLKYSPDGSLLYAVAVDGGGNESGRDVAVTNDGAVFVTGIPLLLKFSADGIIGWAKTSAVDGQLSLSALTQDSSGNLYGAGAIDSYGDGLRDFLLTELDAEGSILSALIWGTQNDEGATAMAIDRSDNFILAGLVSYGVWFTDGILLRYGSHGNILSELKWEGSDGSSPSFRAVVTDSADNVYIGGMAEHVTGDWTAVDGAQTSPALELVDCQVNVYIPPYVEFDLEDLEAAPAEGYIDTKLDVVTPYQALVMKNTET